MHAVNYKYLPQYDPKVYLELQQGHLLLSSICRKTLKKTQLLLTIHYILCSSSIKILLFQSNGLLIK